jgi:hypothetical protein
MNPFFRKKEESSVRALINDLRDNMDKLRQLDNAKKEKFAEHVRRLMLIQSNFAFDISKTDPREGKKLTLKAEQDEIEVKRFLTELGVGRYSPENQQKIDEARSELLELTKEVKTINQEIDETNLEAEREMSIIERSVDESIRKIEKQMFKLDPIIASKQKLKEWLRFRK